MARSPRKGSVPQKSSSPEKGAPAASSAGTIPRRSRSLWKKIGISSVVIIAAGGLLLAAYFIGKLRRPEVFPALGYNLALLVVSAAEGSEQFTFQSSPVYPLEVRAGKFAYNQHGQIVVESLDIKGTGPIEFQLALRAAEIRGSAIVFEIKDPNCVFRVDVVSTFGLFKAGRFVVTVEKWSLDPGKGICRIDF